MGDEISLLLAPIFLLFLGLFTQHRYKVWLENKEKEKIKNLFLFLLRDYKEDIHIQINSFERLISVLPEDHPELDLVLEPGLISSPILKFDQRDLFSIFLTNEKTSNELLAQLLKSINYIAANTDELNDHYKRMFSSIRQHEDSWNNNIEKIVLFANSQMESFIPGETTIDDIRKKDHFMADFYEIYLEWRTSKEASNIQITSESLLPTLRKFFNEHKDPRSLELLGIIEKCDLTHRNLVKVKNTYRQAFSDFRSAYSDIEVSVGEFLNHQQL